MPLGNPYGPKQRSIVPGPQVFIRQTFIHLLENQFVQPPKNNLNYRR